MGEALLSRILDQQLYLPQAVLVSEPQAQRQAVLSDRYRIQVTDQNQAVLDFADTVLLAIKPQVFNPVVATLTPRRADQLIISILAGVTLPQLESAFPNQPIVRAMPNTPATVGAGMTAIAPNPHTTPDHLQIAHQLFTAVGEVVEVPEHLMDAVTGLSGSGPGYIAVMVEALIDGGVAVGLPRAIATQLAIQTLRGTAELLHTSGLHPAQLKDQVTSPGGTTIAGIAHLEKMGVRSALMEAVRAAYGRSKELGQ
jgi:pyrroline-5-carboxylate reductase